MLISLKSRLVLNRLVLFLVDLVCVVAALKLAYAVRFSWEWGVRLAPAGKVALPEELYFPLQTASVMIWMAVFVISGFYRQINLPFLDDVLRVAKGVFWGWLLMIAGGFLYRGTDYSRIVSILSGTFLFLFVLTSRQAARFFYQHIFLKWAGRHRVLVLGKGRLCASIQRVLSAHPELEIESRPSSDLESFQEWVQAGGFREVYVGDPDLSHSELISMAEMSEEVGVVFRIVPDILELRMGELILDESLGLPTFQVKSVSLYGWTFVYKRAFDMAVSLILLTLGAIPLALLAILIKWDSAGPIFFRQERVGYKGKIFRIFKFRSMRTDAESRLEEVRHLNERPGPLFKIKKDPRVTRVGRWIRRLSIDEVPQLFNVLAGDMSLVGPRPQLPKEAEFNDQWARKRLNVLPGISGLWQVSGRAQLSYEEMIELDVFYIEHWSPGLDLKILLKTIPTVLGRQGAY
jgi:exopolysaccharide biosynthesis polyprenyl glycosylphosphotransferase